MPIFALRALNHRNYRLFFAGQSISLIGTWMTRLATSWLVYRLTGSGLMLGLVSFAGLAPTFLLVPMGGVWADRLNRQSLLIVTQVLLAFQALAMSFLTLGKRITVLEIICLSLLQGVINAVEIPGRNSFVLQLVEGQADASNAIALSYSMDNLARLAGPALAGVMIAAVGEGFCFLIDGLSYLAVIMSLTLMRLNIPATKLRRKSATEELKEGWFYVSNSASIRTILLLFAIVSFVGVPYTVVLPLFASRLLHGGPHTFGFLMGATGVGALLSGVRLAARKSNIGLEDVIAVSAGLFGAGLIAFSASRIFWLSLALSSLMGFGMMQQFAASNTVIQILAPEDKRGRVLSYWTMAYMGALPVGSLVIGGLSQALGSPTTFLICGLGCLTGAIWFREHSEAIRFDLKRISNESTIVEKGASGAETDDGLQVGEKTRGAKVRIGTNQGRVPPS